MTTNPLQSVDEALVHAFMNLGFEEKRAREVGRNKDLSEQLTAVIAEAGLKQGKCEKSTGAMLFVLASNMSEAEYRSFIASEIVNGSLKTEAQVTAAIQYVRQHGVDNKQEFHNACGVGVIVTEEEIKEQAEKVLNQVKDELLSQRYQYNYTALLRGVRDSQPHFKWAEGKLLKRVLDETLLAFLGPKTEEDLKPKKVVPLKKEVTAPVVENENGGEASNAAHRVFGGEVLALHKPGENPQLSPEIMQRHLEATGGKVVTRFPPEPNGFLHLGHAKAIHFNFSYAAAHGGITYLRFDDTNPEAEEQRYFDAIEENVKWLGFTPYKVTYASDNFDQLYEYALQLIREGKAYVCHQTPEQIKAERGGEEHGARHESPWRNRPVEESLRLFEEMRNGKAPKGSAVLRMKQDMTSGNPFMWDLVAYRILDLPHVRTGNKWRIYPTYDFTHCLCDSIENITHSLCTTEFQLARECYYWVCDALRVYKPVQWEYARLNLTRTLLSKRKLTKLVQMGLVRDWDDPRLYTLAAVRRRGFTAKAINQFVESLGVRVAQSVVEMEKLEAFVREDLNTNALRLMAVLDPLKMTLIDFPEHETEEIEVPNHPLDPSRGSRRVPLSRTVWIDRSDFREEDQPNYYRLAPGKTVALLHAYHVTCTDVRKDASGKVVEVMAICDRRRTGKSKARGNIQWVSESVAHRSPVKAEVRLYNDLFLADDPEEVGENTATAGTTNPTTTSATDPWLKHLNPHSLITHHNALLDVGARHAQVQDKFQFLRIGYFCVDPDSTPEKLVFNLTVGLKEDPRKPKE